MGSTVEMVVSAPVLGRARANQVTDFRLRQAGNAVNRRFDGGVIDAQKNPRACRTPAFGIFSSRSEKTKRPENFLQKTIRVASAAVLLETGKLRLTRQRWKTRPLGRVRKRSCKGTPVPEKGRD